LQYVLKLVNANVDHAEIEHKFSICPIRIPNMGKTVWALREGDWKLVQNSPMESFELYNLAEDPKEQRNLAEENEEKFNEMAENLRRHIQQGGRVPWQKP
jgi:hypothetical protein